MRAVLLFGLCVAAGCQSPPLPAVEAAGGAMAEIPAGEFDWEGRRVFLPRFWIQVEPGPPAAGLVVAEPAELAKARAPRYGLGPGDGTRHVRRPAPDPAPVVAWRPDFWGAVDEARRRNCLLFVTCHWDGCGNCDRFRSKICLDPRFVAYVNAHVVPLVGHQHHPGMAPHAPLPDGRCWIYPGLTCAQHRAGFDAALDAMEWFPMSPGHAILTPDAGPTAARDGWVMVGDEDLPDEGTVESWIATFEAQQAKLGAHVTADAYDAARREFEAADAETLIRIAADADAAFRTEAIARLEGDDDAARMEAAETAFRAGRMAEAAAALGAARGLRALQLRRGLERAAWRRLTEARCTEDLVTRRARYDAIIGDFAGLDAAAAAREERGE